MNVDLHLEGAEALAETLESISDQVTAAIEAGHDLALASEPIRARMAQLAPHRPGPPDLRDAIVISPTDPNDTKDPGVAIGPSREAYYGRFQEFGTVHHPAQPFVRPAFDALPDATLRALGALVWAQIEKAAGNTR